jgi:hypothetical protein
LADNQREKRVTIRALLALIVFGALTGCATVARIAALEPNDLAAMETRTYEGDYNAVYAAAKKAFQDAGYDIATSNRDAGVISTGYRSERMSDPNHGTTFESRTRASLGLTNSAERTTLRARWFWDISDVPGQWHDNSRNWTVSDYRSRLNAYFDLVQRNVAAQPQR